MAVEPTSKELHEIVKKWRDHYGYKDIQLSRTVPEGNQPWSVKLTYPNGFNYTFFAYDTESMQRKIAEHKPKIQDVIVEPATEQE